MDYCGEGVLAMVQYFVKGHEETEKKIKKSAKISYVCKVDPEHSRIPRAMHLHRDQTEVVLVAEGSGLYNINNREYRAKKGDLLFFDAGILHDEMAAEETGLVTYCIGLKDFVRDEDEQGLLTEELCPLLHVGEDFPVLLQMFSLLFESVKRAEPYRIIDHLLQAFLLKLAVCTQIHQVRLDSVAYNLGFRIKHYIDEHYMEALTLRKMAEALRINEYYLAHTFKEIIGYSPMQYVSRRRIGEAQNLLINTSENITRIALQLGYNNSNYFQMVFNTMVGMSPGRYRKSWVKDQTMAGK
jgi:AraC-like DNA-binding protein/mannose-6-phosphate isomerase-like protein (cupin superfamily)